MTAAPRLVTRLDGAVIGVPAPADTAGFLRDALDFDVRPADGGAWHVRCDGDYADPGSQRAIALVPRDELGLVCVRFAARPGARPEYEAPGGIAIACGPAVADEPLPPAGLRPLRLGHVNLTVPDPRSTAAFFQDVLGLQLSEQVGDLLFFLRIGSEHHNVGLRRGARADLHHISFEVGGWESYRPILDRLAGLGHQVEYGPGRHGPGDNLFTYLRDPYSGLRVELFADMAQIRDEDAYVPRRWRPEDRLKTTLNRWGPLPPESFLA